MDIGIVRWRRGRKIERTHDYEEEKKVPLSVSSEVGRGGNGNFSRNPSPITSPGCKDKWSDADGLFDFSARRGRRKEEKKKLSILLSNKE